MKSKPLNFTEREDWQKRASVSGSYVLTDPQLGDIWGAMSVTASGVNITPDNARRCPEVDACIGLIEDTVAQVPVHFCERIGPDEHRVADENPLHALLNGPPNEWQSAFEFRQMMEGYRQTHGNAYARIRWAGSTPVEIEPYHPLQWWPFRTQGGGVAYRFTPIEGGLEILMPHEVLHLRDTPARRWNLVMGESKVERHRETIGRAQAEAEYLSRFFSNNATPKHALVMPGQLGKEAYDMLEERWERRHAGLHNAHRLAFLEAGMDIKAIGMNNEDAQTVENYKLATAQIARIFGVPLYLINETTANTSWGSGIEQQSIGFITYYMLPKFVAWEQALDRALMSKSMARKFYYHFEVDGLLRGDFKTRMEGYGVLIQWGICTPNEIRRRESLSPLPGGDERLIPLNMVPASQIMNVLLKAAPPAAEKDTVDAVTRDLIAALIQMRQTPHLREAA